MSENKDHPRWHVGRWLLWALAGLVLYVGSIGPMSAWVVARPPSEGGWTVIDTVYQPVTWMFRRINEPSALYFYEFWWENHLGATHGVVRQRRPGEGGGGVLVLMPR